MKTVKTIENLALVILSLAGDFAVANESYSRAGWVATISDGLNQVEATATILDERTIQVEHFTYDGTAPLVYFYLGGNDTHDAFVTGLEVPPLLTRPYVDESLTLTLPEGETLDNYTALSVWCAAFDANFGSAVFKLDDPADADGDGDIDLDDYVAFEDCMAGPNALPAPTDLTEGECLDAFDRDGDDDVDAADFGEFQTLFTGLPAATAEYELVFESTWSAATHPQDFPDNPHFSGLVGATHDDSVVFWEIGGIASQGVEEVAELGSRGPILDEVYAAISAGSAERVIFGGGIALSPGSVSVTFTVSHEFPLATAISMLAPSPDWFVGVSGTALFSDNQWTPQLVVQLDPYDAGTDSGMTYTSPNQDTVPQDPIQVISGYPFQNGAEPFPLGTFTFRRID
ncbi:MAG: DM13 domain-containing protein [Phycisphaerales bacterium]|nr:MAG: DM13 domain-containing protein [Phycisphaerales bacterium]